jgi:hypothetical protein
LRSDSTLRSRAAAPFCSSCSLVCCNSLCWSAIRRRAAATA